ncbi:RyR domain-containing protein [Paramagnetospirillum marisnigri]|uniref:RyR domain-containing protein n=1 Tax=Paramagnetospirillum marisnigri TaxID=1285242 RepID=UPI000AA0D8FF|nr:RyR domain-containing protein [Paramagnetospirillum marisnigri]
MAIGDAGDERDLSKNMDKILENIKFERDYTRKIKAFFRIGISILAFLLGWWGYIQGHKGGLGPTDLIQYAYQAIQLLTFNMPADAVRADLPWQLQVARFALPGLALYTTVGTYLDYARRPLRTFWSFRRKDHIIVVGGGEKALEVTRRCVAQGHSVVVIVPESTPAVDELNDLGVAVTVGAISSKTTFTRTGINHARAVLILTGVDVTNLQAMLVAREAASQRSAIQPLLLACEVQDSELTAVLSASFAEQRGGRIECHIIDFTDNVARQLVPRLAPVLGASSIPHLLVVGGGDLALHIIRKIILNGPEGMRITVATRDPEATAKVFYAPNPGLENFQGLRFIEGEAGAGFASGAAVTDLLDEHRLDAALICTGDEAGIAAALSLCRGCSAREHPALPIFVRQRADRFLLEAARLTIRDANQAKVLFGFGDAAEECSPDLLLRGTLDRLARHIHEAYLAKSPSESTSVSWENLPETFRESCRRQADHVCVKLAWLGLEASPGPGPVNLELTDETLERLAAIEHWRWCVDRWLDGWIYGETKSESARTSPYLVPYDMLSDEIKALDRDAVRNLPDLLARAGMTVRRVKAQSA